jgi:UDP-N-acetylmuramoylalanine-D-glutamate ligase
MKTPYLEVSEIQDFKKLDLTKHRGLLVDDVDFEPLSRGVRLNILDSRASKTVDVKYGSVTTEAFIPRIVTTNNINAVHGGLKELERRIKVIFIPEQISSKFDLQINIQNIEQNYYFGDNIGISKEKLAEMLIEFEEIKKRLPKQKEFNNGFDQNLIDIK